MTFLGGNRKTILTRMDIRQEKRGSFGFPDFLYKEKEAPEEVWAVSLHTREGFFPEVLTREFFETREEADEFVSNFQVGSEYPSWSFWSSIKFDDWVELGFLPLRAGDEELYLPWHVLSETDITDENGLHTSQKVLDFLGSARVENLKEKYGENWEAVAEFEYCLKQLPNSSAAFIAAACRFYYFVMENDFKAGYLLRDLEILVYGVEAEATRAIEMRKKAGEGGSRKSAQAREARRANLLAKIEFLSARSPDILKFGQEAVAKLACEDCAKEDPNLWTQGRGQVFDYLGEIRRGEAGLDMKNRFEAIFGSKPPKRYTRND
jgi:hypothetical protein